MNSIHEKGQVSMLAWLVDVEHIHLLIVQYSFQKNYYSFSPPFSTLSLFLSFQITQHLTLRPQGFNENPELHWGKQRTKKQNHATKDSERASVSTCKIYVV